MNDPMLLCATTIFEQWDILVLKWEQGVQVWNGCTFIIQCTTLHFCTNTTGQHNPSRDPWKVSSKKEFKIDNIKGANKLTEMLIPDPKRCEKIWLYFLSFFFNEKTKYDPEKCWGGCRP